MIFFTGTSSLINLRQNSKGVKTESKTEEVNVQPHMRTQLAVLWLKIQPIREAVRLPGPITGARAGQILA